MISNAFPEIGHVVEWRDKLDQFDVVEARTADGLTWHLRPDFYTERLFEVELQLTERERID